MQVADQVMLEELLLELLAARCRVADKADADLIGSARRFPAEVHEDNHQEATGSSAGK